MGPKLKYKDDTDEYTCHDDKDHLMSNLIGINENSFADTKNDFDKKLSSTPFNYLLNEIDSNPTMKKHKVKLNKHIHGGTANLITSRSANDVESSDCNDAIFKQQEVQMMDSEVAAFTYESPPNHQITCDRFISIRAANENDENDGRQAPGEFVGLDEKFETKIELFKIDHQKEEEQRKNNHLVCDHQKTE